VVGSLGAANLGAVAASALLAECYLYQTINMGLRRGPQARLSLNINSVKLDEPHPKPLGQVKLIYYAVKILQHSSLANRKIEIESVWLLSYGISFLKCVFPQTYNPT